MVIGAQPYINLLKPMNYTLKMGEFYELYVNKVFCFFFKAQIHKSNRRKQSREGQDFPGGPAVNTRVNTVSA